MWEVGVGGGGSQHMLLRFVVRGLQPQLAGMTHSY